MSIFEFDDQQGVRTRGTLRAPGATPGDVLTVGTSRGAVSPSPGGGSQPGAVRVLKYEFDFSMAADLAIGVPVWTPAVNDWLLGAWFEADAAWPSVAVAPLAEIGVVIDGAWANMAGSPGGFFNAIGGTTVHLSDIAWNVDTQLVSYTNGTTPTDLEQAMLIVYAGTGAQPPKIKFRTTDPLSLVVSGDGSPSGAQIDADSGTATLYIVVCTPGDAS